MSDETLMVGRLKFVLVDERTVDDELDGKMRAWTRQWWHQPEGPFPFDDIQLQRSTFAPPDQSRRYAEQWSAMFSDQDDPCVGYGATPEEALFELRKRQHQCAAELHEKARAMVKQATAHQARAGKILDGSGDAK